jgi:hypothetical protein
MSYSGTYDNMPMETVDESADYTDMMGQASVMNQAGAPSSLRTNPTKALIAFWVFLVLFYALFGYLFRGRVAG